MIDVMISAATPTWSGCFARSHEFQTPTAPLATMLRAMEPPSQPRCPTEALAPLLLISVLACYVTLDPPGIPASPAPAPVAKGGAVLKKITPAYPVEAMRLGVTGTVALRAVIDLHGCVTDVEIFGRPHVLLEQASRQALEQWQFEPLTINGVLTRQRLELRFDFRGERGKPARRR